MASYAQHGKELVMLHKSVCLGLIWGGGVVGTGEVHVGGVSGGGVVSRMLQCYSQLFNVQVELSARP